MKVELSQNLRKFLVDKDFRQHFLKTVRDPEVVYYWLKEFPLLKGTPQGPILTRLEVVRYFLLAHYPDTFLRPKLIRNTFPRTKKVSTSRKEDAR